MSEKTVSDYSNVTVKIEEDDAVRTEVDSGNTVSSIPVSDFIPHERGNVLKFDEDDLTTTQFVNPEPVESGPSGISDIGDGGSSGGRVKPNDYPECDKAYLYKTEFYRHITGVHLELKNFVCSECNGAFTNKSSLKQHLDTVHHNLKRIVGGECQKGFTMQTGLNTHVDSVRENLKKYTCGECDCAFTQKGYLRYHLNTVHRKVCGECQCLFSRLDHLKKHLKLLHKKLIKYTCDTCNRDFKLQWRLKNHVEEVHKKIKTFVCGDCPCAFPTQGELKKHSLVHKKPIKFTCGECHRTFTGNLKTHLNTVHRKLKKFSCGECQCDFAEQGDLIKHVNAIHSNDTVNIEDFAIKTEVYSNNIDSSIPLSDFIPDERVNVLEFDEGDTWFVKPEPVEGGPSGISDIGDSGYSAGRAQSNYLSY